MAPVNISRNEDEGKVTVRISNWLLPILLSLVTFVAGAFATSIRAQDKLTTHDADIKELKEVTKGIQPASDLVTQKEFQATMNGIKVQLGMMNENINRLVKQK